MRFERLEAVLFAIFAAGSLILSGVWVVTLTWILLTLAGQLVTVPAFAQTRPAVELERAITQEQVDGDLNAAIAAYQKIAGSASAPREVRAKALLQLAGCYEKLGRQAADVYQQIVREFADQPAAVQARTRLAALRKEGAGVVIAKRIAAPNPTCRTDGRSVVYRDFATGELIFGDLAGRVKRVITKLKPGELSSGDFFWWAPSKDFSMVAIAFRNKPDRPATIAVVKTDGTGYRELVRNDEQGRTEGLGFDFVPRLAWSWDNRYLLVSVSDANPGPQLLSGGSLLVVSVSDGKRRRLTEIEGGSPYDAKFSPDGRFVAYEVFSPANAVRFRTFVMPAAGGKRSLIHEERGVATYTGLLDWTADGRYLAITASTAAGPTLHLFPVEDGQAAGPPIPLRPGQFYLGSTTPAGALAAWLAPAERYVARVAPLDADGRPGPWQQLDFGGRSLSPSYLINWSPDSNQIVYTAESDDVGQLGGTVIRVRNLTTGQDREIHRIASRGGCLWIQTSKVLCGELSPGDPLTTKTRFYSISLESGAIEQHPPHAGVPNGGAQVSRDGHAGYLAMFEPARGKLEFVRRDIETGQETVLDSAPSPLTSFRLSPDENWLIRCADLKLEARPTSGGDWKPLATVSKAVAPSNMFFQFAVTPDSKWVVYHDADAAKKHGLFRVPISGGASERLGEFAGPGGQLGIIEISPDGRKILAGVLSNQSRDPELWLLESFVPAAPKR